MAWNLREWTSSCGHALFAFLLLACSIPLAHATVGRTPGSFSVTGVGSSSYTIPIFAPPGPQSLQPSVAMVYNSNAQFSVMGRGWALAGFSSISRCNETVAQDNRALPYFGGVADRFCLDGNRLRHTSGSTYGTSGSVYMTEVADFSRITAGGTAGLGPQYWTVEHKSGLIYTYGGTSDSRVIASSSGTVREWMVNEIRDRAGNKVRFRWKTADSTTTGTTHPTKVEWTQTSAGSGTYVNSMDFIYIPGGNSPSSTPGGNAPAGDPEKDSDLLIGITVSVAGTVKRNYVLDYQDSPTTNAKRLETVTECSDGGPAPTDCLLPTSFTYQDSTPGVNTASPILSLSGSITAANGDYDFNGDGIKEIAYQLSGTWYVRFGSASSGYGSAISTGLTTLNAGKLLGKPSDQLLAASGGTWYVYDWNGSSFGAISTGISVAATSARIAIADMDGDGRDDLAYVTDWTYYQYAYLNLPTINVRVRRNTSSGGVLSFESPLGSAWSWEIMESLPPGLPPFPDDPEYWYYQGYGTYQAVNDAWVSVGGDLDGDGRDEINLHVVAHSGLYPWNGSVVHGQNVIIDPTEHVHAVRRYAEGFLGVGTIGDGWNWYSAAVIPTDFNNDGCDDINVIGYGIGLSACRWAYGQWILPLPYSLGEDPMLGPYVGSADWNGDGLDDFFQSDGTALYVRVSAGGELDSAITTGIPVSGTCELIRTDGDGDGLDDIGCLVPGSSLTIYGHNGAYAVPDLLEQVEDGFGVTYNVDYAAIQRTNKYIGYTDASYPYVDVTGGRFVVTEVTTLDGVGGSYDIVYTYFGAQKNLEGRGFAGFEKIESVDSRTGIRHVRQFERSFPKAGMLKAEAFYQPVASGGHPIVTNTITVSSATLDATSFKQRYFPYVSAIIEDRYEVAGTRNGDWITRTEVANTFDNWGNLTASSRVTTDKDSASDLEGDSWSEVLTASIWSDTGSNWCLGLATYSSITHSTTTGEDTVQRVKTFTPDYMNCRISEEIIEPYNYPRRVETDYGYDAFGNVNEVEVKGYNPNSSGMTTRISYMTFGSANGTSPGTGQFPISETNALGQTTTRTFHSTFGSLLTETDPNGIVVASNTYDSFGRASRVTRADGTSTVYTYTPCSTYGCEGGLDRVTVIVSERDTGDSEIRDTRTHIDLFGRPWIADARNLSGGYSRSWRQYDTMGRVEYEGLPCVTGSCTAAYPANANVVSNTYDLLGRMAEQSRPLSQSLSTPVTTAFLYEGRTQIVIVPHEIDPNGRRTKKTVDVNGWLRRSEDHDGYHQLFSYDAAGSVTQVTDSASNPLFEAEYSYGIHAFQDATTDMAMGSWSYTYNSLGELIGWADAKSQTFSQTFDALSRVTSRTEPEGTTTFTFGTNAGSDNIGRLASVSMTGYSESIAYDSVGRPSTQTITTDQSYVIDYDYSSQGMLDTLTYPTSTASARVKVKYGYANGILNSVTDWTSGSAGTVFWTANAQNVRGQTTQETLGNGVVTNRSFDAVTGRLNSIQSGLSGGVGLQNLGYQYDLAGNVTQRQENFLGLTEDFYYDNLYRLDYSKLNGAINLDLTYDSAGMGNIAKRTDVNGDAAWTYHGTKKHAVATTGSGGTSYSYDANGNMTNRGGSILGWSSYNYPTSLATATENTTFYYGPNRQYYRQVYTGPASPTGYEEAHYVGGILEKVFDGTITDWRHYIHAQGQVVAIVSRPSLGSPAVHYPLGDNQESGSTMVDGVGTGYVRQSYEAFGMPRDGNDWDGPVPSGDQAAIDGISRRGYTRHSMLGAMGLIHMNGRVLDADTGRFLSPDPTIPSPGFTQAYNRYAYVFNNPLSYSDPSGFKPYCWNELFYNGSSTVRFAPMYNVNGDLVDPAWGQTTRYWEIVQQCINTTFPDFDSSQLGPERSSFFDFVREAIRTRKTPASAKEKNPWAEEPQSQSKVCTRPSLGSAKISLGAQLGFSVRGSRLVNVSGDINLWSRSQSSDEHFSRDGQSVGGGVSVLGLGFSATTNRSIRNFGSESLSNANWEPTNITMGVDSRIPGVSPELSAPDGDTYLGAGVKILAGLEMQLNLSELWRRTFGDDACD